MSMGSLCSYRFDRSATWPYPVGLSPLDGRAGLPCPLVFSLRDIGC